MIKILRRYIWVLALVTLLLSSQKGMAASLDILSTSSSVEVGKTFTVQIVLDAEGEVINAIEGTVRYPSDLIAPKSASNGSSIISYWIEDPSSKKISNVTNGSIKFSGISSSGFSGKSGKIISIQFEAKKTGEANVQVSNLMVLKHDGSGTPIATKANSYTVNIYSARPTAPVSNSEESVKPKVADVKKPTDIIQKITENKATIAQSELDIYPPEEFKPLVMSEKEFLDKKTYIVFSTQDKGSGIDRYELCGVLDKNKKCSSNWYEVSSPYEITDLLGRTVLIKAIDKSSNERIESVEIPHAFTEYLWLLAVIIIGGVIIGIVTVSAFNKKITRRR